MEDKKKSMVCSKCKKQVEVEKEYTRTGLTHTGAAMLLPFFLCCIPYCLNYGCEVKYKCVECGAILKHYF